MILYTSDENRNSLSKSALIYTGFTCFTALFGAVYEMFSHEVYSYFMIYAFVIPLLLGVLPCLILICLETRSISDYCREGGISLNGNVHDRIHIPCEAAFKAWNSGVATLTVGSLYKGVLDIYGTTNRLIYVYPVAGAILIISGIVIHMVRRGNDKTLSG